MASTSKYFNTTKLPQEAVDEELEIRQKELERLRQVYQYESPPTVPDISFVKGPFTSLPNEVPSLSFRFKIGLTSSKLLMNNILCSNTLSFPFAFYTAASTLLDTILANPNDISSIQRAIQRIRSRLFEANNLIVSKINNSASTAIKTTREVSTDFEELTSVLEIYRSFFVIYVKPPITNVFLEDKVFCRLRTAGFNPMTLFKVQSEKDLPFWINDEHLPFNKDNEDSDNNDESGYMPLSNAISKGLVYAMDLSFVSAFNNRGDSNKSTIENGHENGQENTSTTSSIPQPTGDSSKIPRFYIPSKAIFAQSEPGAELEAVSIEINGEAIYPSSNDLRWELGKMAINTCDAVHHELISHLGRTHLLIEPFIAATHRQLSRNHPIYKLLKPHFEGTIFINDTATRDLVAQNGDIDRIFAGDIQSIMKWTSSQLRNLQFNNLFLHEDLKSRELLGSKINFPYITDSINHYEALHRWVSSYLSYYYKQKDVDVMNDIELQNWTSELVNEKCGQLNNFGDHGNGKIETFDYLTHCITFIIFTCSIQHAAVNFPQKDLMAYAPAVAGAQYSKLPTDKDDSFDVNDWVNTLTPPSTALEQLDILYLLGDVRYTQLGKYKWTEFCDDDHKWRWPQPIRIAHSQYLTELNTIDKIIVEREKNETLKYHYLRPTNIPQSINI